MEITFLSAMGRTIERLKTKKEGLVDLKSQRKLKNIGYFYLKSYKCKNRPYLLANLAILGFKEVPFPC